MQGCRINFISTPVQTKWPHQIEFNKREKDALQVMLDQLEKDGVIEKCVFTHGDYMNQVFLREKKSTDAETKFRMILNMKPLNKTFVEGIHHKMNTLNTCLDLMEPGCFMASIDLSNAFHTIPMHKDFTKFLKFRIGTQVYQYLVLPMGFRDSPRLFNKILKPVLAYLRNKSLLSSVYIDDFFLTAKDLLMCKDNVTITKDVLEELGFEISDKSVLEPTQKLLHLGFILNSIEMTVSLGEEKKVRIKELLYEFLSSRRITIRLLAKIIGTLIATFPAIQYGQLYYRELEMTKIRALQNNYNFDGIISITKDCLNEIHWWLHEGLDSSKPISQGNPDFKIRTDSSGYAWGGATLHDNKTTQGFWDEQESKLHINVKELKAVYLCIQSLCDKYRNCHLQVEVDNQTTVTYINNMGGTHSTKCNELTKKLILWCKQRDIWLSACHIPGIVNTADELSRKINENIEWSLNDELFKQICKKFGKPDIDLFATRINTKVKKYMSLNPDPGAIGINAFAHCWDSFPYIFPPFNLIPRILRKIREDKTDQAIMVVPDWTVALWYPMLKKMSLQPPLHLGNRTDMLKLPNKPHTVHPLLPKMRLMAWLLSGNV